MSKKNMATNQLLPFANGDVPNVLPYDEWNSLPARLTGFQSGIASSQQFNYILAQGGAAGYVLGQLIADFAGQDATIDSDALYANFKNALVLFVPANIADGSVSGTKITDQTIAFQKLAAAAIATDEQAEAGTATNVLMTPSAVVKTIEAKVKLPTAYVTDVYNDGSGNWYRKWSDGFIEQGGITEATGSIEKTITLLVPMNTTNYQVLLTYRGSSRNTNAMTMDENQAYSITNTSFKVIDDQSIVKSWCTFGY